MVFSQAVWGENTYTDYTSDGFVQLEVFNTAIDLDHVDLDLIEAGVYYLTNAYRNKKGRLNLAYKEELSDAAYLHSQQMEKYNFFNHVNRKNRELGTLEKRVNHTGYNNFKTISENIFYGYVKLNNPGTYRQLCQFIVDSFIDSKEHRLNLLGKDIEDAGNGIYFEAKTKDGYWYFYFTQDFGSQQ